MKNHKKHAIHDLLNLISQICKENTAQTNSDNINNPQARDNENTNYAYLDDEIFLPTAESLTALSKKYEISEQMISVLYECILQEKKEKRIHHNKERNKEEVSPTQKYNAKTADQKENPENIAVIGGTKGMGLWFAERLILRGHNVQVSDENTELTPLEAVLWADVIILAVPVGVTEEVIKQIAPHIRPKSAIIDITSLKSFPMNAMLSYTSEHVEVIGLHPMFGVSVPSFFKQIVVVCSGRGSYWKNWIESILNSEGAIIRHSTPEHHDKMMAIIQVLRHFVGIAMGKCMEILDVDIKETLSFTSPLYRLELAMLGRLFSQNPGLYADIGIYNPWAPQVVASFLHAASAVAGLVLGQDREAFIEQFEKTAQYFGDFKEFAMEESDYLISKLSERPRI